MNKPPFRVLGETYWWECPACKRQVHMTRRNLLGSLQTGIDFRCSPDCTLRHCIVWPGGTRGMATFYEETAVFSYDKRTDTSDELPMLARL